MTKEQIQKAAMEYAWRGNMYDLESAFKAGAKWRIKSVWHKAEEAPGEGRIVLTIGELMPLICGPNHENWANTVVNLKITRWAYVYDLIPTEE